MPHTFSQLRLRYHRFILALWQEADPPADDHASWRFSLEDPHTGQRLGFAEFDQLIAFLTEQMTYSTDE